MTDSASCRHLFRLVLTASLTAVFLAAPLVGPVVARAAEPPSPEAAAISKLVDEFVDALNTADLVRYVALFAPDATAFFPLAPLYLRLEDKDQVIKVFTVFFQSLRNGKTGPPYMNLVPEDLKVQRYGNTAVVTFHFKGKDQVSRRTLVLRHEGGKWLIVHMHASGLTLPQQ